jgi:hypothetical protein
MVSLSAPGKKRICRNIHQLVAEAFIGPRPDGMVVCHGAAGPLDNSAANLSYGTQAQNMADKRRDGTEQVGETHPRAKLSNEQVVEIRARAASTPLRQLAREFCVSQRTIQLIVRRKNWTHLA